MPKLLLFAPCEKVIVGREDNVASVIAVLQGFDLPELPPANETIVIPMTWYVFALWEKLSEEDRNIIQRIELIGADRQLINHRESMVIHSDPTKRFHRTLVRFVGFPVRGPAGDYFVRLLTKTPPQEDFVEVAAYPIPISRKPVPTSAPQEPEVISSFTEARDGEPRTR